MVGYHVAKPDQYLAITGMGIRTVKITKRSMIFPFQRVMRFSVKPRDYLISLQGMTKEKLQFLLPVIFTIGPDTGSEGGHVINHNEQLPHPPHSDDAVLPNGHALMKYAMLLASDSSDSTNHDFVEGIVKGIVEGETRVLVSSMTMEEIFTERETFKSRIFKNIQTELYQFGMKLYNGNLKELKDAPNSVYFESLSRKAHEGATQQARIDVAEAQLRGTVGEAAKKGQMDRELAKIHAETAVQKTQRDVERAMAEAELNTRQTELTCDVDIARTAAKRAVESRDQDLKREVEIKRAAAEIERLRATEVVQATIKREAQQQKADGAAYQVLAEARATLEQKQRQADAAAYETKTGAAATAEADFLRLTRATDGSAYKTKTDAGANFEQVTRATDAAAYHTKADATAKAEAEFLRLTRATDGSAYKTKVDADANFDRVTRTTDAAAYQTKADADAWAYAEGKRTEVELMRQQREAQGMMAMAEAYGKMSQAFGGPSRLLQFMMIEKGTYADLARANAEAVRGMAPKISVWTTGPGGAAEAGAGPPTLDTMRNVYQMLPPLMSTIHDQTGITLPEWQFGRLASSACDSGPTMANGVVTKQANGVSD